MSGKFGVVNLFADWKKGDPPVDPFITLALNEVLGQVDGFPKLTATLATAPEIDFEVDQMQRDLEVVRGEAKRVLREQQLKIRGAFKQES